MKNVFIRLLAVSLVFGVLTLSAAKKKPKMEKPKAAGDKPNISLLEPRGIQRGVETRVKLIGTNLAGLSGLKFSNAKLTGEIIDDAEIEAWIKVTAAPDLMRGGYDVSVINEKGESGKVKLYVEDLPSVLEVRFSGRSVP